MFEKIKLASEILLTESLRKIYDQYYKVKKEKEQRLQKETTDRRKLMEELL